MKKLCSLTCKAIDLTTVYLSPAVDLAIRLFMANIFFKSGMLRFKDFWNGQWDAQITAFTEYHPIPGVPGELAAIGGTVGELVLPILLAFGLMTRVGAGGLLVMTLVIQFVVPADYGVANADHYMWMLLLLVPLTRGGGVLSLDYLACKFLCKKSACDSGACDTENSEEKEA